MKGEGEVKDEVASESSQVQPLRSKRGWAMRCGSGAGRAYLADVLETLGTVHALLVFPKSSL